METELSDQDIKELLEDPAAWMENQKLRRQRMIEDAQRAYMNDIEDIQIEFIKKERMAEKLLLETTVV